MRNTFFFSLPAKSFFIFLSVWAPAASCLFSFLFFFLRLIYSIIVK